MVKNNKNNTLSDRMKRYEGISKTYLKRKEPVLIRLDGKSFSTFTRDLVKPFDSILVEAMWETAKYLCKNVTNCRIAYVQSDEISLLLTDYVKETSEAWYNNNVQKMVSVSASMATLEFNRSFESIYKRYKSEGKIDESMVGVYESLLYTALFDSRAYNLPKDEVVNYFIWRQQDAIRNSILMVGQRHFAHVELQGVGINALVDLLKEQRGIDYSNIPMYLQRGACILRGDVYAKPESKKPRQSWFVDETIPLFKENRLYIEKYVKVE